MTPSYKVKTVPRMEYDPSKPIIPNCWYAAEIQGEFARSKCVAAQDVALMFDRTNSYDKCAIGVHQINPKTGSSTMRGFMPTKKTLYNKPSSLYTFMTDNPDGEITVTIDPGYGSKTIIEFFCTIPEPVVSGLPGLCCEIELPTQPPTIVPFDRTPMHYAITYALIQDEDVAEAFMLQWMQSVQQPVKQVQSGATKLISPEMFADTYTSDFAALVQNLESGIKTRTFNMPTSNLGCEMCISHGQINQNDFPIVISSIIVVNRSTGKTYSVLPSQYEVIHKQNYTVVKPKGSDIISGWRYEVGDDSEIRIQYTETREQ